MRQWRYHKNRWRSPVAVNIHGEGKASGALVDVETGRIVLFATAKVADSGLTPTFFSDEKRTAMKVSLRDQLLKKLAGDFLLKLGQRAG